VPFKKDRSEPLQITVWPQRSRKKQVNLYYATGGFKNAGRKKAKRLDHTELLI